MIARSLCSRSDHSGPGGERRTPVSPNRRCRNVALRKFYAPSGERSALGTLHASDRFTFVNAGAMMFSGDFQARPFVIGPARIAVDDGADGIHVVPG
jgi:hypothetical protein